MRVSVILLAGGVGSRMRTETPKQYLKLHDRPLILHSLELFLRMPEVTEVIIVSDPVYRPLFIEQPHPKIHFALPGERRQDSLYQGFHLIDEKADLVCVHDAARPLITEALVRRVLKEGEAHGAATVGMPIKFTVKEVDPQRMVKNTPDRNFIWEIQTPQVIRPTLLKKGFELAIQKGLTVSDDVSLVELTGHPVKLVEGSYDNIKITTPGDILVAQSLQKNSYDLSHQL